MTENKPQQIALFCLIHPASIEKRDRVLAHLLTGQPYYRSADSLCTTWSYFTPSQRPGAPNGITNLSKSSTEPNPQSTMLAGLEIYAHKSALQRQLDDPIFFQPYHAAVKREQLYARDEELVAWVPARGFMARGEAAEPCGRGSVVVVAVVSVKEGARERFLERWGAFADWCMKNEPETLTYSLMTRAKALAEVLVFERYTSSDAFERHRASQRFKDASKLVNPLVRRVVLNEWDEVDGSFVGSVIGGGGAETAVGGSSKL